jgi:hypothetical protein
MLLNEIVREKEISDDTGMFSDILDSVERTYKGQEDDYKIEGRIGKYEIHSVIGMGEVRYFFMLFDLVNKKYAVAVELSKFGKNPTTFQIEKTGADSAYRGLNLPVKLYAWLIQHKNIILVSGYTQTHGGQSIWEKLAKTPRILVFGYNSQKHQSFQIDKNDPFDEDVFNEIADEEIAELEDDARKIYARRMEISANSSEYKELTKQWFEIDRKILKLAKISRNYLDIRLVAVKAK